MVQSEDWDKLNPFSLVLFELSRIAISETSYSLYLRILLFTFIIGPKQGLSSLVGIKTSPAGFIEALLAILATYETSPSFIH